jgi:hypothetical protein
MLQPVPNATDEGNEQRDRKAKKEKIPNMLRKIWNFLFAGKSAAWTAIFTGVLTFFTLKMYQVSSITSETARASERAFLSFVGPALGARISDGSGNWSGQEFSLNWNNSGTTPAKAVVIQNSGEPWPSDLPKGFEFTLRAEKTMAVVGPKGVYGTNITIARDVLVQMWQGKSRLFVWGTAIYKDIFPGDPDRLTEFCAEFTHITIGVAPQTQMLPTKVTPVKLDIEAPNAAIVGFEWGACREHNCYDQDCKDYSERVKDMR